MQRLTEFFISVKYEKRERDLRNALTRVASKKLWRLPFTINNEKKSRFYLFSLVPSSSAQSKIQYAGKSI